MNIIRTQLFRAIVISTLMISSCVYLAYGKESPSVYIARNVAWRDCIAQIASVRYESPQDSLGQKADRDPETLRNELSYKEEQARLGR
jgi:hypothetical protein